MKVIIADDEDKVCQLIYKLVDWESLEMQVCAIVHNGIEALQAVSEHRPDIVITDIRMPGYDGLEMICRAKELCSHSEFIIISGYRHFEYAQNAIKYGVKDYLLKPIKKTELEATLAKMYAEYLEKKKQLTTEEEYRLSVKNNLDKLRSAFFHDILMKKGMQKGQMTIECLNEQYHYQFQEGNFQIVQIKIDGIDASFGSNITYMQDKVLQIVQKRLEESCYEMECAFDKTTAFLVLNYGEDNRKTVRRALKTILDQILLQKDILESLKVTMGAGMVVNKPEDILRSMKTAGWAVEQRLVLGVNRVIEGVEVSANEMADSDIFYEFNKQLVDGLERLEEQQVNLAFSYLQRALRQKEGTTGHEVVQMAREAMNLYLFTMRKHKFPVRDGEEMFEEFNEAINNYGMMEEIFNCLRRTVNDSFRQVVAEKKQEDNKPVREAKRYISKHFGEPISLEIVSDVVGFNATYFSSLFKKETGSTFLEYLTMTRMEKAKELLKETNLNVADICCQVGYNDGKHFTKAFAKYTGLKPNEYRKIYA